MHTSTGAQSLDVVCFPDMEWDYVLWTNRQHVMYRLPRIDPNVRGLYVSPPRFGPSGALGRGGRLRRRELPEGQQPDGLWTTRIGDRLWVLQPLLPIPARLLRRYAPGLLDTYILALTRAAIRRLGFRDVVLWAYSPLALPLVGRLCERLVCYDVVDDYAALPAYRTVSKHVTTRDLALTQRADLVFVASERVFEERRSLNPACHLVGNAADIDLFGQAQHGRPPRPRDLDELAEPIIGFHGAITSDKLDLALCRELARLRPSWTLLFVGPVLDREARALLGGLANVRLVGAKDQAELPAYLAHTAVSIVPYRHTPYTERLEALKLYESLAAGRPVVATRLACFERFDGLVRLADDAPGFVGAIEAALAEPASAELSATRRAAVAQQSWEHKAARMLELIRARQPSLIA